MDREIDFFRTNANITDTAGNLLFSTNGAYIANATGDTMLNGAGLNPAWYTSLYPNGLHIGQGSLILPKPDHPGTYYLFHGTLDDPSTTSALALAELPVGVFERAHGIERVNHYAQALYQAMAHIIGECTVRVPGPIGVIGNACCGTVHHVATPPPPTNKVSWYTTAVYT